MIQKVELEAIRVDFQNRKVLYAHDDPNHLNKFLDMEIDFFTVAATALVELCEQHVKADHAAAAVWLIKAIFPEPKRAAFVTGKDCHVHVMVALDTLVAIAE